MYARPHLMPGQNQVMVAVSPGPAVHMAPVMEFAWAEGGTPRRYAQRIDDSQRTFTIEVGGETAPRMLSLEASLPKEAAPERPTAGTSRR
jgi:hypothetical protein